jgi:hypothetical protein
MALKTRQPTRKAAWPRILLEGTEKSGKSWSLAEFSASAKVGRTVVLVLGEDVSKWDEYGLIEGARFEIAEHDGSWVSIMGVVEDAKEEARKAVEAGEPPFVFAFDTVTAEWEGLKDWATHRCRNSRKYKEILAKDPDAEIDVSPNYWNDATRRHRSLMTQLLTLPGIVVLIARGGEVAQFQNGQPVANRKTWSVEGHKSLLSDVTAHVRLSKEAKPLLVSAFGVHCQIRPGINPPRPLPDDWSLESLVFDTLKLDPGATAVGGFTDLRQESMTPEEIRDEALSAATGFERVRELYGIASRLRYQDATLFNEIGAEEPLLDLLKRVGDEKRAAERDAHEADFVTDLLARLSDLDDQAPADALKAIDAFKAEVNRAMGKVITAAIASELLQTLTDKGRAIGHPAAVAA